MSGKRLKRPVNRRGARECLVWDTGSYLTNMPSILVDSEDRPCFLVPVSEGTLTDCSFWFIRRETDRWVRYRVTDANSTWNGSHLEYGDHGSITAFVIARARHAGELPYGGGLLQEYRSADGGKTWELRNEIVPRDGFVCNNPRPVEAVSGASLRRTLLFYGWEGPDGILPKGTFRGNGYLWQDGAWL